MDRVRFGRALGLGTRQAAKNLMEMANAAMAPDPSPPAARPAPQARPVTSVQEPVRQPVLQPMRDSISVARDVTEGSRRFSESFFSKLKRLGGALWLELAGVFFGIFGLAAARGTWRMRTALHSGASSLDRQEFFLTAAIALTFSYFCVTSFIRARKRERGQTRR